MWGSTEENSLVAEWTKLLSLTYFLFLFPVGTALSSDVPKLSAEE
jgi:hypothetical protein